MLRKHQSGNKESTPLEFIFAAIQFVCSPQSVEINQLHYSSYQQLVVKATQPLQRLENAHYGSCNY